MQDIKRHPVFLRMKILLKSSIECGTGEIIIPVGLDSDYSNHRLGIIFKNNESLPVSMCSLFNKKFQAKIYRCSAKKNKFIIFAVNSAHFIKIILYLDKDIIKGKIKVKGRSSISGYHFFDNICINDPEDLSNTTNKINEPKFVDLLDL